MCACIYKQHFHEIPSARERERVSEKESRTANGANAAGKKKRKEKKGSYPERYYKIIYVCMYVH